MGFEKTPYSQWDASAWRPVVSFDSVWSGDEDGIYGRMGRAAAGIWGGAYDGDWRDLWIFDSYREFTDCPVPSVSVSHDRCGGHQNGSRPVWCRRAAAGRAGWQLPEYGRSYYLSGVGLPGSDLHILCFICTGSRLGEASSRTIWKRGMEKRHLFVWHRACFWE